MIVGPHGSGKSTLVASLVTHMQSTESPFPLYSLRFSSSQSAWESLRSSWRIWEKNGVVILDGYEQLSWLARNYVAWLRWQRSMRVLVTTHRRLNGFDCLWQTESNDAIAARIVHKLVNGCELCTSELLATPEWAAARSKHGPNVREALFDMYDWWQNQSEPMRSNACHHEHNNR